MNRVQFGFGLIIILVGATVIISPELDKPIVVNPLLATFIAVMLMFFGAITIYDAVYGKKMTVCTKKMPSIFSVN